MEKKFIIIISFLARIPESGEAAAICVRYVVDGTCMRKLLCVCVCVSSSSFKFKVVLDFLKEIVVGTTLRAPK